MEVRRGEGGEASMISLSTILFRKAKSIRGGGGMEGREAVDEAGRDGAVRRRTNLSMRTSKNRRRGAAERTRYTRAGRATGRSGRVAVLPSASLSLSLSLFCSVFLFISSRPPLFSPSRNISLARPFHLPRYLSLAPPRPLLLLQPKVLLLLLLSYAARHHHLSRSGGGHYSPLLGHHARSPPLLLARKMRILIRYCLILFMYARA